MLTWAVSLSVSLAGGEQIRSGSGRGDGVTIPVLLGVDRPTTGDELYDLVQRARG